VLALVVPRLDGGEPGASGGHDSSKQVSAEQPDQQEDAQVVLFGHTLRARPSARPAPAPSPCTHPAQRSFVPVSADATDAATGAAVLALPRDAAGVPGVPPLSTSGKNAFAWDASGVRPGSPDGNVLLNAHTWPDGSALGNRLLAGLDVGEQVVLHGATGVRLCYRVTERVEVRADQPFPRYYGVPGGPPQVAIVVCSGSRLGPGQWTHRTVWFARPVG
jgi:hypothetical protein